MMNGFDTNSSYGMMQGNFNNGFGFLIMIITMTVIIYAIFKLFNNNQNSNSSNQYQSNDGSLEVLKSKLVKGEITEDDYLRMKKIIQSK